MKLTVIASILTIGLLAPATLAISDSKVTAKSEVASAKVGTRFGLTRVSKLLAGRDVQRELGLTTDQLPAIFALLRVNKASDELDAKLVALLTKEQAKRLRQIQIQVTGANAAFDASVQTDLNLTEAQKTELAALLFEVETKGCALESALDKRIRDVLTEDQETALTTLGGEVFVLDKRP